MSTPAAPPKPQKPFTLSQKILFAIAPPLVAWLLRFLDFTNRVTIIGMEKLHEQWDQDQAVLVGVFHENILPMIPQFAQEGVHVLASQSKDGELGVRLLKSFGVDCVRGSSTRGGSDALSKMSLMAQDIKALGFAIDGPRGPRRKSKAGIAVLSQRTGIPIAIVAATVTKSIRVKSWDRTCVPLPFGRVVFKVGDLILPPESDDRECIAAKIIEVESKLNALQESLEAEYGVDPLLGQEYVKHKD